MSVDIPKQSPRLGSATLTTETPSPVNARNSGKKASAVVSPTSDSVAISTLASRLSKAEQAIDTANAGLSTAAIQSKLTKNLEKTLYPLDSVHKAQKAKEVPDPVDAVAMASAEAATNYLDNRHGTNPFSGLSRDQLTAIYNDESGTFTTNEKYAAWQQAFNEEESWRAGFVERARLEYQTTGKQTVAFTEALDHFNKLPTLEKSLYPMSYASDLQERIDRDYNYFTDMSGNSLGTSGRSLADIFGDENNIVDQFRIPDIFKRKDG